MKKLHTDEMDKLFEAILSLEDIDECYSFFQDLCTIKELKDMASRLKVAKLLDSGNSYKSIEEETGVSQATISRVKKSLEYGYEGYDLVIKREKEREN